MQTFPNSLCPLIPSNHSWPILEAYTSYNVLTIPYCPVSYATVLTPKALHFFTTRCILSVDALNCLLPVFIRHFFRINWEGGERECLLVLVLLLKVSFPILLKLQQNFFFLQMHPISQIFKEGAPCVLGWVGLSIGTGLASSSKKARGPFAFRKHGDRTGKFHVSWNC